MVVKPDEQERGARSPERSPQMAPEVSSKREKTLAALGEVFSYADKRT
jgi:hypothetical protein